MIKLMALLTAGGLALHHYFHRDLSPAYIRKDKKLRDNLSEKQLDRMIEASFPASDSPSTY